MKSLSMLIGMSRARRKRSQPPPSSARRPAGVARSWRTCAASRDRRAQQSLNWRCADAWKALSTISISQSQQTVVVEFAQGASVFSPAVFRDAVDDAGVRVSCHSRSTPAAPSKKRRVSAGSLPAPIVSRSMTAEARRSGSSRASLARLDDAFHTLSAHAGHHSHGCQLNLG